jgi:hypothetical protein
LKKENRTLHGAGKEVTGGQAAGVQEFRSSGVQEFRSSGVQEFRSSAYCGRLSPQSSLETGYRSERRVPSPWELDNENDDDSRDAG